MTALVIARATVLFALGLLLYVAARRTSAAVRHAILTFALVAALLAPFASRSVRPRVRLMMDDAIVNRVIAPSMQMQDRSSSPGALESFDAARVASLLWAIGVALVATHWVLAWLAADRLRNEALRTGRRVMVDGYEVIFSDAVTSAATVGLFRPVILAPNGGLPHAAFVHEAAHVRRRDAWTMLIAQAATALYWFHPLAWFSVRLARLEQERACDDEVLRAGVHALDYAGVLLHATRERRAALLAFGGTQIEARLRAIIDPIRRRAPITLRRAAFGVVMMFGALTVVASVSLVAASAFDPPESEELPDVALVETSIAEAAPLRAVAEKQKTWRGDLVAQRARWALATIDRGGVAAVRDALNDDDWRVRAYAAWSLAVLRDGMATLRLVELLEDPVWRMRAMAATAIAHIGDPRAQRAMEIAATDRAWQVRCEAARYLRARGAAPQLVATLANDSHIAVRSAATGIDLYD